MSVRKATKDKKKITSLLEFTDLTEGLSNLRVLTCIGPHFNQCDSGPGFSVDVTSSGFQTLDEKRNEGDHIIGDWPVSFTGLETETIIGL